MAREGADGQGRELGGPVACDGLGPFPGLVGSVGAGDVVVDTVGAGAASVGWAVVGSTVPAAGGADGETGVIPGIAAVIAEGIAAGAPEDAAPAAGAVPEEGAACRADPADAAAAAPLDPVPVVPVVPCERRRPVEPSGPLTEPPGDRLADRDASCESGTRSPPGNSCTPARIAEGPGTLVGAATASTAVAAVAPSATTSAPRRTGHDLRARTSTNFQT